MQYPPQQGGPGGAPYEFGSQENVVIRDAAKWMTVLAVTNGLAALAGLDSVGGMGRFLSLVVSALLLMGASSLKQVVDTQGNDVGHLMAALDRLHTVFTLRVVARLVAFVLAAFAAAVLLMGLMAWASLPPEWRQ